jgi:hypothetical protein
LGDVLNERLHKRLGEKFGKILCKGLYDMLDPNMLHVYFRQASRRIQEILNLFQFPNPDDFFLFFSTITVGYVTLFLKKIIERVLDSAINFWQLK